MPPKNHEAQSIWNDGPLAVAASSSNHSLAAGADVDAASLLRHHRLVEKRCSQCGAVMTCQPEGGCWCAELPHCMPMPANESEGCLCRKCLLAKMESLMESAKAKQA